MGKKSYLCCLEGDAIDGSGKLTTYHFRMKGVTKASLIHHANLYFGGNMERLYRSLISKPETVILNIKKRKYFDRRK